MFFNRISLRAETKCHIYFSSEGLFKHLSTLVVIEISSELIVGVDKQ